MRIVPATSHIRSLPPTGHSIENCGKRGSQSGGGDRKRKPGKRKVGVKSCFQFLPNPPSLTSPFDFSILSLHILSFYSGPSNAFIA